MPMPESGGWVGYLAGSHCATWRRVGLKGYSAATEAVMQQVEDASRLSSGY